MSGEITNYGELKTAVQTWLNRRDDVTIQRIPYFINFAEKSFTRLVRLPYYESLNYMVMGDKRPYIELPPDFLSLKHLMVNEHAMTRVDNETFMRINRRNRDTLQHQPYYFTRMGTKIITYPTLKEGDFVQMIYNRDIPEMKDDTDSPYSLIIAPDVLLYLSLQHASIFLRDNDQEKYWGAKATEAAQFVMTQLDEAEWSGSSLQITNFDNGE